MNRTIATAQVTDTDGVTFTTTTAIDPTWGAKVKVVTYWHTPSKGEPYLVVDVITEEGEPTAHRADGTPAHLVVNVNDGAVYEARQAEEVEKTWTVFGHWENSEIVVDALLEGSHEDDREDDGRWEEGLFCDSATGTSPAAALRSIRSQYQPGFDEVAGNEDHGRCDTCGAPCGANGHCTENPTHLTVKD